MKRMSALALFTVAAMGLSACGSEDSNDAAGSDSSANSSAQQDSAAKDEDSTEDDSKKGDKADESTRAKSTKKSGPNPTVPETSDQTAKPSPGDDSSSEPRRNARATPAKSEGLAEPLRKAPSSGHTKPPRASSHKRSTRLH